MFRRQSFTLQHKQICMLCSSLTVKNSVLDTAIKCPRGLIPEKLTITFYKNNNLEVPHHSLHAAHFLVCPCRKEPPYTSYRCMYIHICRYIPLLTSLLFIFLLHGLVLGRYEQENILFLQKHRNWVVFYSSLR